MESGEYGPQSQTPRRSVLHPPLPIHVRCSIFARGFWHSLLLLASYLDLILSTCYYHSASAVRGGPFLRILFLALYSRPLRYASSQW